MMAYNAWDNRPPITMEDLDPTSMVELTGYQSAQEKIESMMEAGIRLVMSRSDQYLIDGDSEDVDFDNPLATRGLEMADLAEIERATHERMSRRKAERELEKKEKQLIIPETEVKDDTPDEAGEK